MQSLSHRKRERKGEICLPLRPQTESLRGRRGRQSFKLGRLTNVPKFPKETKSELTGAWPETLLFQLTQLLSPNPCPLPSTCGIYIAAPHSHDHGESAAINYMWFAELP